MYLTNSQLNVKDNGKRSPVESESCIEFMILSLLLIFFEVYDLLPAYNFHATYFRIPSRWVIDLHSMTILKVNSRKIKFFFKQTASKCMKFAVFGYSSAAVATTNGTLHHFSRICFNFTISRRFSPPKGQNSLTWPLTKKDRDRQRDREFTNALLLNVHDYMETRLCQREGFPYCQGRTGKNGAYADAR